MHPSRTAFAAIVLTFAVTGMLTLAIACGGDDAASTGSTTTTPTPDFQLAPYFQQLDSIFQKASDDSFAANDALGNALNNAQSLDDTKAAYGNFLTATELVFESAITSMDGLTVPSEAKADHDGFIAAANSSKSLAAQLLNDLSRVTTETALQTMLDNFGRDKGPLLTTADDACTGLQETASTHGVNVNLACSGE